MGEECESNKALRACGPAVYCYPPQVCGPLQSMHALRRDCHPVLGVVGSPRGRQGNVRFATLQGKCAEMLRSAELERRKRGQNCR